MTKGVFPVRRLRLLSIGLFAQSAWCLAQVPPPPSAGKEESADKPKLFVAQRIIDMGKVIEGDKIPVTWRLENQGKVDLVIEHTRASCGCTVVQLEEKDKVIPPGQALDFRADFDSRGRLGLQQKTISVYSNDVASPVLQLELMADVQSLYEINPSSVLNLGTVKRGDVSERTIDLFPGPDRGPLVILSIDAPQGGPLVFTPAPYEKDGRKGQRITMTVSETASPGPVNFAVDLKIRVGDVERQRSLPIRGQIVGALTWLPQVVDATRVPSHWGKRLSPVVVKSTDSVPFQIVSAQAGPYLNVETHEDGPKGQSQQHTVSLIVREGAPAGPFAASLEIKTNLLEQPVIRVPVFGIVADPVEVEPPLVLLRQDGTPLGTHRRVKLQSLPQHPLEVSNVTCDQPAVKVTVKRSESVSLPHIAFLQIELTGTLPPGRHEAKLTVTTNVPGGERMEIPVSIEVPDGKG